MYYFVSHERSPLTPLSCPQMPEEEAFCVFVRLMQEYRLRELFKPSMAELGLCIYQFEYLLQVREKPRTVHFRPAVKVLSREGQQITHSDAWHGCSLHAFEICQFFVPQEQLPELNVHFRSQSFHTSMYASSWFLTLFLTFLPLPVATRIFDIFMYEVEKIPVSSNKTCSLKELRAMGGL